MKKHDTLKRLIATWPFKRVSITLSEKHLVCTYDDGDVFKTSLKNIAAKREPEFFQKFANECSGRYVYRTLSGGNFSSDQFASGGIWCGPEEPEWQASWVTNEYTFQGAASCVIPQGVLIQLRINADGIYLHRNFSSVSWPTATFLSECQAELVTDHSILVLFRRYLDKKGIKHTDGHGITLPPFRIECLEGKLVIACELTNDFQSIQEALKFIQGFSKGLKKVAPFKFAYRKSS